MKYELKIALFGSNDSKKCPSMKLVLEMEASSEEIFKTDVDAIDYRTNTLQIAKISEDNILLSRPHHISGHG